MNLRRDEYDLEPLDDFDDLDDTEGGSARSRRAPWLVPVTVLVAVIVVAGGGAFALKSFMKPSSRSADGAPPIVRADETPTKTKPQEPGGMQIDNQDKTIYSQIGNGDAALVPPSAQTSGTGTLPAPEAPLPRPVAPEVATTAPPALAMSAPTSPAPGEAPLPSAAPTTPVQVAPVDNGAAPTAAGSMPTETVAVPTLPGTTTAPSPSPTASDPAATPLPQGTTKEPVPSAASTIPIPPAPQPGGSGRTLSPPTMASLPPAGSAPLPPTIGSTGGNPPSASSAVAVAAPPSTPAPKPAATKTSTPVVTSAPTGGAGNTRIQIGAFSSEKEAQQFWTVRRAKYPDLLGNLTLRLERVDSGPKAGWIRVQGTGLASRDAAQSVCSSLKAKGQDCLVIK
ncbi:MAG: SPOR domain-containing protein [Alphaproteobacteria bacterium]